MKTLKNLLFSACIIVGSMATVAAQEIPSLHANAATFIKTHFQGQAVYELKIDVNDIDMYEVKLADGTKVEFDREGEPLKMKSDRGLPYAALPMGIGSYAKANYPGNSVVEFETERYGFEIEFANSTELKFDNQGKFLKIDR